MTQYIKRDIYQELLDKTTDRNIPLFMQFELTSRCNLQCIHCYNVPDKTKKELSTKEIKSILDELSDCGTLFMSFTGGEILCRKDFFQIARHARKKSFALRLYTNATMITPEVADKILDIQPLTVEISFYAVNPQIHDRITAVTGSYSKTRSAIDMLLKRGLNIVIKSVIMKENADEYEGLKAFADGIGARFVYDYIIIPRTDSSTEPLSHCMSDFEINNLLCKNVKRDALNEENLKRLEEFPEKSQPLCGAAKNGACISPFGDVYPCVTWRISIGNLKEKAFREIWNSAESNQIRDLTIGDLKYCSTCKLFYHCVHCPGMALLETGDSLGLSPAACHAAQLKKGVIERAYSSYV